MEFEPQVHHFHPLDYFVFVLALVISLAIGIYYACSGGKQRTVQEYLLGDRQMKVFPVAMSLIASFLSAIGMISVPAEIYMYGCGFIYYFIGYVIAIPLVSMFYLPTFYNLQLTSVYEYLERRFDKNIRKIGSILYLGQMMVYTTLVIYAPALALSQVTGLGLWVSIVAVGVLGTIYTAIGGIKAVMWTDAFQICIVFIALGIVTVKGIYDFGGFSSVFTKAIEGQRLEIISFSFDPRIRYTMWGAVIGCLYNELGVYGTNQAQVQRYMTSPSLKDARRGLWWNLLPAFYFYVCAAISGLLLYAKYWNCDPMSAKLIKSHDQVFPLFVMETLNTLPGLPGLFVAGIFCGSLSTVSSALNSLAAITLEDFVRAFSKHRISSERSALISKFLAAGFGILCLLLVAAVTNMDSNILQVNYYNKTFSGAVLGLFTLGMVFPWINRTGAYASIILGLGFAIWVSINTQMNKQFTPMSPISTDGCVEMYGNITYRREKEANVTTSLPFTSTKTTEEEPADVFWLFQIAHVWIQVLTCIAVILIGNVVSLATGPTKLDKLDLRLLSPPVQQLISKYYSSLVQKVPTEEPMENSDMKEFQQEKSMKDES